MTTLYWHDYETSGTDPQLDRPLQFAGLRTDEELNIIGEPLVIHARPSNDFLPHPEACLVTGITPQKALEQGVPEADFIRQIHAELSQQGTCGTGYNSIRFDDEFTRNTLYRNLFDPYAREWQHGNSRWDIIDLTRTAYALRPEGIEWPRREDGSPSFRLEELTRANGLEHASAHDALSDVHATIALARLLRKRQPRLYQYLFGLRHKQKVLDLLNLRDGKPVVHISGMIPSRLGCATLVLPLARHPGNANGIIVFDLREDPRPLLDLDAKTIRQRVFTARDDLPEGVERIPLKVIHVNRCPVVAPLATLEDRHEARLSLDRAACLEHAASLLARRQHLEEKIREVFRPQQEEAPRDPDLAIYSGGFFTDDDRRKMEYLRKLSPAELSSADIIFDDPRLPEMVFRYRARNWPETLSAGERAAWEEFRQERLRHGPGLTLDEFNRRIESLRASGQDPDILNALERYAEGIILPGQDRR